MARLALGGKCGRPGRPPVAGAVAVPPSGVLAQRGGAAGQRTTRAPAKDTTKAPPSVSLDFQDQDLKVVLDALAAAGEINV